MKAGWKVKPLGEVCELKPPKKQAKAILSDNDLVSFAGMSELSELKPEFSEAEARPLSKVYSGYTYFADGDVLVAKITPCFENGKMGIARNLTNGVGFGSSEFVPLRTDGTIIPEFLFYYLLRDKFRQDGAKVMSGAVGHKRVPHDYILELMTPIPPLEEQKQIVAVLDAAFEGLTRAKENAEANLQNARELFERSLDTFYVADLAGWPSISLGEISDIKGGKRLPKGQELQQEKTDWPYIRVADFDGRGSVCLDDIRYLSKDIRDTIKRYTISSDDVFITIVGATVGKSGIVPIELSGANLTENACKLVLCDKVSAKYIYYFTISTSFLDQVGLNTRTAAQPKLALMRLKTISLGLPPLEHQAKVSKKLDELRLNTEQAEANYTTKLTDIADLRQSLLQKAFAGELT